MEIEEVSNKKVIALISNEHRKKLKKISEIENKGLSAVNEEAIDYYYNLIVYSHAEFEKFIKRNPRLSLYSDSLKKLSDNPCCPNMIREIMQLDEACEGKITFSTFIFQDNPKKLLEYINNKTESVVMVLAENPDGNYKKLREKIMEEIDEIESEAKLRIHTLDDENLPKDKTEIFIFTKLKEK